MSERIFKRCTAVLVYSVRWPGPDAAAGWRLGPLPLLVADDDGRLEAADDAWRRRHTAERVHGVLYDAGRRHRSDVAIGFEGIGLTAVALELLRVHGRTKRSSNALLSVHIDCGDLDGSRLITSLKALARDLDDSAVDAHVARIEAWLPPGSSIDRGKRIATSLTFVTLWPGSSVVTGPQGSARSTWDGADPRTWASVDQWRWSLAMLTPPGSRRDPRMPEDPGTLVRLPAREAQITPRGVAVMGIGRDGNQQNDAHARRYAADVGRIRTVYLDAVLLGVAQRMMIDRISDDAADLVDPANDPRALRDLQRELRVFRNRMWWRRFTTSWGGHPDKILLAHQDETYSPPDLGELISEINDYSLEVEVANTRRTNVLVAILALTGVLGVIASTLAVFDPSDEDGAIILGVSLVVLVLVGGALADAWGWRAPSDDEADG